MKKIEEVIYYISEKIPGLTRTQMIKLLYLIDRKNYENNGCQLTESQYYMYFYGPYCDEYKNALDKLITENLIRQENKGVSYKIYFNKEQKIKLTENEKNLIDTVLNFAKKEDLLKSAKNIKEYVYTLEELQEIEALEKIDFGKIFDN